MNVLGSNIQKIKNTSIKIEMFFVIAFL
jgi:hypothetical protein